MEQISCEKLQKKILLCDKLSQTEKEHIAQCESCRALSLQMEKMLGDLSKMSVPGLKDGSITDKVMTEIKRTKSASFPRFKITNHIGTVAALVIVFAIFAFNKFTNTNVTFDSALNGSKMQANFATDVQMSESENSHNTANEMKVNDNATSQDALQNKVKLTSSREASDEEKEFEMNVAIDFFDEDGSNEEASFESYRNLSANSQFQFNDTENFSKSDSASKIQYSKDKTLPEEKALSGSAGGGSSHISGMLEDKELQFEESVSIDKYEQSSLPSIFDKEMFSTKNSLEENVNKANEFVKSLFENANMLNVKTLYDAEIDNDKLCQWLDTVSNIGEYSFESLYAFVQGKK